MIRAEVDETKLDSGFPYCFEEGEGGGIPIDMLHLSVSSNRGAYKGGVGGGGGKHYMVKKNLRFLFSLGMNNKKKKRKKRRKEIYRN